MSRSELPAETSGTLTERYPLLGSTDAWLWGFVAVGFVLDVTLTYYGLSAGLQEGNPVARRLFPVLGVVESLLFLKGVVVGVAVFTWLSIPDRYRPIVPLGIGLPWVVAAGINLSLILRL